MELGHHISHHHLPNAPEEQLNAVTALGERVASGDITNECPLCGHAGLGLKLFVKHVGRHLEQLALFALPSLEEENPDHHSESEERISAAHQSSRSLSDAKSSEASLQSPYADLSTEEEMAVLGVLTAQEGKLGWLTTDWIQILTTFTENSTGEQVTNEVEDQAAGAEEKADTRARALAAKAQDRLASLLQETTAYGNPASDGSNIGIPQLTASDLPSLVQTGQDSSEEVPKITHLSRDNSERKENPPSTDDMWGDRSKREKKPAIWGEPDMRYAALDPSVQDDTTAESDDPWSLLGTTKKEKERQSENEAVGFEQAQVQRDAPSKIYPSESSMIWKN